MCGHPVCRAEDLIDVVHRPDLGPVHLHRLNEYDPGTRVRDAVIAALDFLRETQERHWIVDLSRTASALSHADCARVSNNDFRARILASPLRKFVLLPPGPESGQDGARVAEWEANTLSAFGEAVEARVCADMDAAAAFLAG